MREALAQRLFADLAVRMGVRGAVLEVVDEDELPADAAGLAGEGGWFGLLAGVKRVRVSRGALLGPAVYVRAVLAHELGHFATGRRATAAYVLGALAPYVVLGVAGSLLAGAVGFLPFSFVVGALVPIAARKASVVSLAWALRYGETLADAAAFAVLPNARGITEHPLVGDDVPWWRRTHPTNAERARAAVLAIRRRRGR